jgi:hypothetical protein
VVILNDCDIRFLVLVFELVLAFLLFFFFIFLFLFIFFALAFLLFLFKFSLLLQFADTFSLADFVVTDDAFAHFVIIGIDEFPQNLFLFIVLFLELFVEDLNLAYFGGQLEEAGLKSALVAAKSFELLHELHVIGLHVSEDDELLGVGKYFHLD